MLRLFQPILRPNTCAGRAHASDYPLFYYFRKRICVKMECRIVALTALLVLQEFRFYFREEFPEFSCLEQQYDRECRNRNLFCSRQLRNLSGGWGLQYARPVACLACLSMEQTVPFVGVGFCPFRLACMSTS